MRKLLLLLYILTFGFQSFGQKKYTVDQIPNPKLKGASNYVSNPDGVLDNVSNLNSLLSNLEKETKIQFAIVVVKEFDKKADEFDFALSLFRKWKIGQKDLNNGLLLFVSVDRKKYRFITGYGLEGDLPDVTLNQLATQYLVPNFKQKNYSKGVESVTEAVIRSLSNDKANPPQIRPLVDDNYNSPPAVREGSAVAESSSSNNINPLFSENSTSKNRRTNYYTLVLILATAFVIGVTIFSIRKINNYSNSKLKISDQSRIKISSKTIGSGCFGFVIFMVISYFLFSNSDSFFSDSTLKKILMVFMTIMLVLLYTYYTKARISLSVLYFDDENYHAELKSLNRKFWWFFIFNPLLIFIYFKQQLKQSKLNKRFEPIFDSHGQVMERVDRDEDVSASKFISKGQHQEEILGVNDYDIWQSGDKKEVKVVVNEEDNNDDYDNCPDCDFKTLSKPKVITIREATYSSEGSAKKVRTCANCKYEELIKNIVIPVKQHSSSGSSSSSSGSSSSSSSSSSFGGGSSGGGGSGGSW